VKHTKHCADCNVKLTKDNWYLSRRIRGERICIDCFSLFNRARMTINNKRMSMGNPEHPFYHIFKTQGKIATYKAMGLINSNDKLEFIKKETIALYDKIVYGDVYIITNPAWKGWIKVGRAVEAKDRCKGYQTGSPLRDYNLEYKKFFDDRAKAEALAHKLCAKKSKERNGEWFKLDIDTAIQCIENVTIEKNHA
jgi:hypothetical protein